MYKCLFPIHIMIQVARLIVVTNLATSWRQLHWQQIWSPGGATWLPFLAKLLRIALLASSAGIELISSSTTVSKWCLTDLWAHRSDPSP